MTSRSRPKRERERESSLVTKENRESASSINNSKQNQPNFKNNLVQTDNKGNSYLAFYLLGGLTGLGLIGLIAYLIIRNKSKGVKE